MLYRLAFQITEDGYLRVRGVARNSSAVSALHLNEKVSAQRYEPPKWHPSQTLRLLEAAREAGKQPGVDICCEVWN
jgi:hypothetical protein